MSNNRFNHDLTDSTLDPISGGKTWRPIRTFNNADTITKLQHDIRVVQNVITPRTVVILDPRGSKGIPLGLISVNATEDPLKVQGRTVSQVAITFIRRSDDPNFQGVRIWFKNYNGMTEPQLVASGADSPLFFNVETTYETVDVLVEPVGANTASAGLDFASITRLALDGVVSAPPAPSIAQSLIATPTGYQFSFNQLSSQLADVVDCYRVYRNTTSTSGTATVFKIIKHDPLNGSVVTVQDTAGYGITFFYWVSAVDTSGLESTLTPSQSGLVFGDVIPKAFGKNLISNPGFEFNDVATPLNSDITTVHTPLSNDWYVYSVSPYQTIQLENNGNANTGVNNLLIRTPAPGVTVPSDGVTYAAVVVSRYKIPVSQGDILRIKTQRRWDNTATLPAGAIITQGVGLLFFDADDNVLSQVATDTGTPTGTYTYMQAAEQVPATIGGGAPSYVRVQCNGAIANSSGSPLVVSTDIYADMRYDDLSLVIQSTAFDLTPLNTAYTATGGNPLTAATGGSPNHVTVSIAGTTLQYGDGQVSYNAGSITPLNDATKYFIYADDPTYSGGSVVYQATTQNSTINAANGRVYFGLITTPAFGGAGTGGSGGGNGACFSPNTEVVIKWGNKVEAMPISQVMVGDCVLTRRGWSLVTAVLTHKYSGIMHDMGNNELVTPAHRLFRLPEQQIPAAQLYPQTVTYDGLVHNLSIAGDGTDATQCYTLANGEIAHNVQKADIA